MERNVLKAVGFDLGIPLSYTFLRRYAQVTVTGFVTIVAYLLLFVSVLQREAVVSPRHSAEHLISL